MTDPRDLISAATPLPWRLDSSDPSRIYAGAFHELSRKLGETGTAADAALIVYAVNNLPALLDVADALERLTALTEGWDEAIAGSEWQERIVEARAALARLQESRDD